MTSPVPEVELRLPSVLKVMVGQDRIRVSGRDLHEALEAAYAALPQLRYHIALDSGELRPHVLCSVNGDCIPRHEVARTSLSDGDEIWIQQAISGG